MSASNLTARIWTSTIGLKFLMAVTGLAMVGFVLQHMTGHLQVFAGKDAYNSYAAFMQGLGPIKWGARAGLIGVIVVHIACAVKLTARNMAARPNRYEALKAQRSTPWGRSMILSGWVILAFILFHLAHFTFEVVLWDDLYDAQGRRDVYTNFVHSFQNPIVTLTYLLSVLAVSLHLSHAVSSMFRTLGLAKGRFKDGFEKVGPAIAVVSGVGFAMVPIACLLGLVS